MTEKKYLLHIWLTKDQVNFLNKMFNYGWANTLPSGQFQEIDDAVYILWDEANSTRATEKDGRVVGGSF